MSDSQKMGLAMNLATTLACCTATLFGAISVNTSITTVSAAVTIVVAPSTPIPYLRLLATAIPYVRLLATPFEPVVAFGSVVVVPRSRSLLRSRAPPGSRRRRLALLIRRASRGDENTTMDATSARAATTATKSGVETHYLGGLEFRCAFHQREGESFAPLAGEGRTSNGCP